MKNILSKRESKYRYKLFYENGYRKSMQENLDYYVNKHNTTYKSLYYQKSLPDMFMMYPPAIAIKRITKALKKLGVVVKDASGNFKSLYSILSEVSDKWEALSELE